jgi:cystathionine beta-lyase family protein involved in aluminum resistance
MDTVFRQATKTVEDKPEVMPKRADTNADLNNESFLGYEMETKKPYLSEYFGVQETWNEPLAGFKEDFEVIESYFKDKINHGEMEDTIEAVKEKLKWIEKMANIDKTERTVMKIEKIKAFVKFLKETDQIKVNGAKYAIK